MVKIRLARWGGKKHPFYRIVASNSRSARNGRFIEQIGTYDPMVESKTLVMQKDRLDYWLGVGAQPSDPLKRLISKFRKEEQSSA